MAEASQTLNNYNLCNSFNVTRLYFTKLLWMENKVAKDVRIGNHWPKFYSFLLFCLPPGILKELGVFLSSKTNSLLYSVCKVTLVSTAVFIAFMRVKYCINYLLFSSSKPQIVKWFLNFFMFNIFQSFHNPLFYFP